MCPFVFKVKWWEVQTDIRNASEALSDQLDNSVTIHGLQTKTVYQLRVQGVSAGGDGQMSNPIFFTLQGMENLFDGWLSFQELQPVTVSRPIYC